MCQICLIIKPSLFLSRSSPQPCCHLSKHAFLLLQFLIACLYRAVCTQVVQGSLDQLSMTKENPGVAIAFMHKQLLWISKTIAVLEVFISSYE
jgi:hypothetical protein